MSTLENFLISTYLLFRFWPYFTQNFLGEGIYVCSNEKRTMPLFSESLLNMVKIKRQLVRRRPIRPYNCHRSIKDLACTCQNTVTWSYICIFSSIFSRIIFCIMKKQTKSNYYKQIPVTLILEYMSIHEYKTEKHMYRYMYFLFEQRFMRFPCFSWRVVPLYMLGHCISGKKSKFNGFYSH